MGDESEQLAEALVCVERWLDIEHHCFPSAPVASSIATLLYEFRRLTARAEAAERERDGMREAITATRALVSEGAMSGFTDPAWQERLFFNQRDLTAVLSSPTPSEPDNGR